MSSDYFMNQAFKNMAPFLAEDNKLELIGTITAIFWLIGGMFSDPILMISSMAITIAILIYLTVLSFIPTENYFYDLHVASFRRLIVAGLAHWMYTTGSSQGPEEFDLIGNHIPILQISQLVLLGLVLIWFATKYYDQLRDPNLDSSLYPSLLIRGILRGAMIAGMLIAVFSKNTIDPSLAFPYLFIIYLVEPFVYGIMQSMNKTVSRVELTLGNARLPSVALRESFLSNFFILLFTMVFDGVNGQEWQLLRVYYILGTIFAFIYSFDAIKKFSESPLGKQAIGSFFEETPTMLSDIDLEKRIGHVINEELMIDLSKKSGLNLEPGSIIVPLEESKGKMSALVIGKGQSVLDTGSQKVGEVIDGVSTILIPTGEYKQLTKKFIGTQLSSLNFDELNLPSLPELQEYVGLLANNFSSFVSRVKSKITEVDLSSYGITENEYGTEVNLPGIYVNETPDLTTVRIGGLRVNDHHDATTVRIGSSFTVVDLPKASFVSMPGITVLDIAGKGTAVSLLGLKISDGLSAVQLDEFKHMMLSQLDRWEQGADAELGRFLADKSATGLMSVNWDGDFNFLLDSKKKTLGNHLALESSKSKHMVYLPPNFDEQEKEQTDEDLQFIELTGIDPTPAKQLPPKSSSEPYLPPKGEKVRDLSEFGNIIDVELEEEDEED